MDSVFVYHTIPLPECLRVVAMQYLMTNVWQGNNSNQTIRGVWRKGFHELDSPRHYFLHYPPYTTCPQFETNYMWLSLECAHECKLFIITEEHISAISSYMIRNGLFHPRLDVDVRTFFQ